MVVHTDTTIAWNKVREELKTFIYRKVRDKVDADDIVHDVFLKVHEKIAQLKDREKIMGWIYQITRNAITDHFRRKAKSIDTMSLDSEMDSHALNDCVASCLSDLLVTLPPRYREALELAEIADLSQTSLAQHLNISYSGAKSRVQRARKMLKEKMDERYLIKTDAYGNITVCESRVPCNCSSSHQ